MYEQVSMVHWLRLHSFGRWSQPTNVLAVTMLSLDPEHPISKSRSLCGQILTKLNSLWKSLAVRNLSLCIMLRENFTDSRFIKYGDHPTSSALQLLHTQTGLL